MTEMRGQHAPDFTYIVCSHFILNWYLRIHDFRQAGNSKVETINLGPNEHEGTNAYFSTSATLATNRVSAVRSSSIKVNRLYQRSCQTYEVHIFQYYHHRGKLLNHTRQMMHP